MMDYTIFGESHGPAVGVLLRDVPPGLPVDEEFICRQLLRRAPQDPLSTARHEPDQVEVLSGVYQGVTTGMPVCLLLRNRDVRSADYDALRHTPRPSHADYTAWVQSGGRNDPRGGGAFSGRLTAPLVAAGALAKSWLKLQDIKVNAQVIDENALRQRRQRPDRRGTPWAVRCAASSRACRWLGRPGLAGDGGVGDRPPRVRHPRREGGGLRGRGGACRPPGQSGQRPLAHRRPEGLVCHQSQRRHQRRHHQRDAGGVHRDLPPHPLHRPAARRPSTLKL